jgi:hypothetical protein
VVFGSAFCESGERSEPDEVKRWVYNLYGLTDEETEIVKEAVGD